MRGMMVIGMALAMLLPQVVQAEDFPSSDKLAGASLQDELAITVLEDAQEDEWGAIPALPLKVLKMGKIRFINGGVSQEAIDQLKSVEDQYNVRLLIVGTNGEYVGDAAIRITDAKGTLRFALPDAGPYLYMKLPAGSYRMEAEYNGKVQKFNIKPSDKRATQMTIRVVE